MYRHVAGRRRATRRHRSPGHVDRAAIQVEWRPRDGDGRGIANGAGLPVAGPNRSTGAGRGRAVRRMRRRGEVAVRRYRNSSRAPSRSRMTSIASRHEAPALARRGDRTLARGGDVRRRARGKGDTAWTRCPMHKLVPHSRSRYSVPGRGLDEVLRYPYELAPIGSAGSLVGNGGESRRRPGRVLNRRSALKNARGEREKRLVEHDHERGTPRRLDGTLGKPV